MTRFKPNAIWRRIMAGAAFFILFTLLLSSGLFASKLHLVLGEPSPQLITAPWDMEIVDEDQYLEDQKAAEANTPPVYKPNEEIASAVIKDLGTAFTALRDGAISNQDNTTRINKLRQTSPFTDMEDIVLSSLIRTKAADINDAEQKAGEIIIGRIRNVDTGARTEADVPVLRDRIKSEINQTTLSPDIKVFLLAFVDAKIVTPTLQVDKEITEKLAVANRNAVKPVVHHYKANQKIIGAGEIVDKLTLHVLEQYRLLDSSSPWRIFGGISLLALLGMAAILFYIYQYKRHIYRSTSKLVLIGVAMLLVLFIGKGVISLNLGDQFNYLTGLMIPVAWAATLIAILINAETAFMVCFVLAVFTAVLADPMLATSTGLEVGMVAFFGGIAGVHSVSRLSQRSNLASSGLVISAVNILVISGIALVVGMRPMYWLAAMGLGVVNGLASSVLTVGTLHWFESAFGITSAMRLLEFSSPNRPLLKKLLIEAPGTYHHSILVGNLAEAAAEAVHADAILVRVASMYHDIGKLKRPYFFIENQFAQDNPHDKITPTLSSLIITSHIKDGVELAKEYKLPEPIIDIIVQHHGDSLVNFFYHKAKEENEEIPEEAFHYDGPRPQTKEAALVCLADSVEAAVRSMKQATPGRIEGLVRKVIKDKFNDGQLDQCELTFRDLDRIAIAFVRVISGIFHSRVEYPDLQGLRTRPVLAEAKQVQNEENRDQQDTEDVGVKENAEPAGYEDHGADEDLSESGKMKGSDTQ